MSAIVVACGGGVEDDGGGTAGSGGTTGCPESAPQVTSECAPAGLSCSYEFNCQGGPASVTYACNEGRWLPDTACTHDGDWCYDRRLHCQYGNWVDYTGAGGNPPSPCPEIKPAAGATCTPSSPVQGVVSCGYRCDGDAWTVGGCQGTFASEGVWLFDGACSGDCSVPQRALLEYALQNRECVVDADCKVFSSSCALGSAHCSGAFVLGLSADAEQWAALDAALTTCAAINGGNWDCSTCDALPPAPTCVSGWCTFAGSP